MRILWIDDEPARWNILQKALMSGTYLRKHIAVEVDMRWYVYLQELGSLVTEVAMRWDELSASEPRRKILATEFPAFRPYLNLWFAGRDAFRANHEAIAYQLFCKKELA